MTGLRGMGFFSSTAADVMSLALAQRPDHGSFHLDDELGWCQQTHATDVGERACLRDTHRRLLVRYTMSRQSNGLLQASVLVRDLGEAP